MNNREDRRDLDLTLARGDVEGLRLLLTHLEVEYARQAGGDPRRALAQIRECLILRLSSLTVSAIAGDGRSKDLSKVARERAQALLLDAEEKALQLLEACSDNERLGEASNAAPEHK